MKTRIITIIFITFLLHSIIYSAGSESVYESASPYFLSGGWSSVSTLSPQADSINPAASARNQRITLDLSYMGFGFDDDESGWKGLVINGGSSIPTKAGVFSFSGHFRNSPEYETVNLGTQFDLNTSFSKELYENFLTGAGFNFSFGEGIAATVDAGLIHMTGDWFIFPDFRWGIAVQELGWVDKEADYPEPFTLTAGAGSKIKIGGDMSLDTTADITFPFFQNARFSLGADLSFRDQIGVRFSSEADAAELIDGDMSALIPSFGIYYNYKASISEKSLSNDLVEKGWNRSSVNISTAAAPMGNGLWCIGGGINLPLGVIDNKPPEIELDTGGFRFLPAVETDEEDDNSAESSNTDDNEFVSDNDKGKSTDKEEVSTVPSGIKGKRNKNILYIQQGSSSTEKGIVKSGPEADNTPVVEYISPNNDGKFDDLEFPLGIRDSRYVTGFALVIQDTDGNIVRKIGNKEERPENAGFSGFFKRLFYVEKGISIPDSIRWDGTSDEGETVSDGKYIFYLQAWDDNGNQGYSTPYAVVVDNTAPEVTLTPPDAYNLIFSPDGDGNKDTLPIGLEGSNEDLWVMEIRNSSENMVKTFNWENSEPEDIIWDGRSGQGEIVPDDVYYCTIYSTDKAGNSVQTGFENIIINTIPTPVSLSVSNSYFSPGNVNAIENIELIMNIPVRDGIIDWTVDIKRGNRVLKSFTGKNDPPESIYYDGKNDSGFYLSEGICNAELKINYINGSRPSAVSPDFHIDTTPPDADVNISYTVFSPNGDDNKDTIKIYQETSREDEWTGTILDQNENSVSVYTWIETPEPVIEWDGYYGTGERAPDGNYSYRISSTDRAGNYGESRILNFTLDTEETPVLLSAGFDAFSPNEDSVKDSLLLKPELRVTEGIDSWTIRIFDTDNSLVREYSGSGSPDEIQWDGFTGEGRKAPDGEYKASVEVVYEKGDVSNAVSRRFLLDTEYPDFEYESNLSLFSPDGDEELDDILVEQTTSTEDLWIGTITDSAGNTVKEYFWKNNAQTFRWDGKDSEGNLLPDGEYGYTLVSEDKAGNRSEGETLFFRIDASPRIVYVTTGSDGFSPNRNGSFEEFQFNVIIPNKEGISSWSLKIENESGTPVKTFSEEIIPERIVWDGTGDDGDVVRDGIYTGKLLVEYVKGNKPESTTTPILIDTMPPELDITILPLPFSPDNDGVDDEVSIYPAIDDTSEIQNWNLTITDRTGKTFKSYKGTDSLARSIIWDGKGDSGELVTSAEDYFYSFTAMDIWNNETEITGIIPVDVLVIRIGDLLKIQIASIQFAPDSPELSEDSQEIIDRNIYVLKRVSEILRKYQSYRITIEGHAALLRWNDPVAAEKEEKEELQPLSKARAETVKNYLVHLGISENRINTLGRGGTQPVVPHSDTENRWKNRRVEFILEK